MGRFRRSSGYLHLSMQSFSKWRMVCVAVVRLCVTAAESKHAPWRRIQNRGKRIRETDRRVNTEWQSRQWWERKRHSLRFGGGVCVWGGGIKQKLRRFQQRCETSLFFFSPYTLERRCRVKIRRCEQKVQLNIFSLLHNSPWSLWKTNSIHFIVSSLIRSVITWLVE